MKFPFSWNREHNWRAARMAASRAVAFRSSFHAADAAWCIEKSHIVMVHRDMFLNAVHEAVNENERGLLKHSSFVRSKASQISPGQKPVVH